MAEAIWIVRKHPPHPFASGRNIEAFTIVSTHPDARSAREDAKSRNTEGGASLYSVGRVALKKEVRNAR